MSQILRFPDMNLRRTSKGRGALDEKAAGTKGATVIELPSWPVPVMTGDEWNQFIRLLTPDERQAFMADVWRLISHHCRHISGDRE